MRNLSKVAVVAILGSAFGFAQDKGTSAPAPSKGSVIHKLVCPAKDAKCEGDQKKACENVIKTGKSALENTMAKCKKENLKCKACEKKGGPCEACEKAVKEIVGDALKKQAAAKDATHGDAEPGALPAKCTLTSGPVCKPCTDEIAEALFKKCKEIVGADSKE